MHYFGLRQPTEVREWLAAQEGGVCWIEDLSHALFTAMLAPLPLSGEIALTSYRKLMPVPDGSTLAFRGRWLLPKPAQTGRYRAHSIVRAGSMAAGGVAERMGVGDAWYHRTGSLRRMLKRWRTGPPIGVGGMSGVSRFIVERFDIGQAAAARRENAARLSTVLAVLPGWRQLVPLRDEVDVPLALPFRVPERAAVQRALAAAGILTQHLWPAPPTLQRGAFPAADALADETMCFPIDERYTAVDMDQIGEKTRRIVLKLNSERQALPV